MKGSEQAVSPCVGSGVDRDSTITILTTGYARARTSQQLPPGRGHHSNYRPGVTVTDASVQHMDVPSTPPRNENDATAPHYDTPVRSTAHLTKYDRSLKNDVLCLLLCRYHRASKNTQDCVGLFNVLVTGGKVLTDADKIDVEGYIDFYCKKACNPGNSEGTTGLFKLVQSFPQFSDEVSQLRSMIDTSTKQLLPGWEETVGRLSCVEATSARMQKWKTRFEHQELAFKKLQELASAATERLASKQTLPGSRGRPYEGEDMRNRKKPKTV